MEGGYISLTKEIKTYTQFYCCMALQALTLISKKMSPLLSNDLRVITIDLPGFGLTGAIPSKDYSINSAFNVINELAENLEIDKFSIGGNSMGGRVSWRYASAYPEKVYKLILIASGGAERPSQTQKSERPLAWKLIESNKN